MHPQRGATFAARLNTATEELARLGYDDIVLVGSDCPGLTAHDITEAFRRLAEKRLVLGPDHRGGCYLIALHAGDRELLKGIRWNRNSDYEQLSHRVSALESASLPAKQDVDNWADVRLLARSGYRLVQFVLNLLHIGDEIQDLFVDLSAHAARVLGQRPPPSLAA